MSRSTCNIDEYWWDDAIGLYRVRHRVYRPEWGRWLQRDPLGYAPGWNLYQNVKRLAD